MVLANAAALTFPQIWHALRAEASAALVTQPTLAGLLGRQVLAHDSLPVALAHRLAQALSQPDCEAQTLLPLFLERLAQRAELHEALARDLQAYRERDPACASWLQPLLFFKGFAAVATQRVAHLLWQEEKPVLAWLLQNRASELWQVDIHPAAQLGAGLFIDHATGVVIGETAVVGTDVTIMHGVTLGGNGKERGDRHPKIGDGVLLSVGAKVLGNIRVGNCARVAGGSVVLRDVPPHVTVAGIPAQPVGQPTPEQPADCLDHAFTI